METEIWNTAAHTEKLEELKKELRTIQEDIQSMPAKDTLGTIKGPLLRMHNHRRELQQQIAHEEMFVCGHHLVNCVKWHKQRWADKEGYTDKQLLEAIYALPAGAHRIMEKVKKQLEEQNA